MFNRVSPKEYPPYHNEKEGHRHADRGDDTFAHFQPEHLIKDEKESVIEPPYDECPVRTMPETGKEKDDPQV